jgi:hypothetical protein
MTTLNDAWHESLVSQLGHTGTLNDLTYEWLENQTGVLATTLQDQWYLLLTNMGYSGVIQGMQMQSWSDMGAPDGSWNDMAYWFWTTGGGVYGPSVLIVDNEDPSSCDFQPPITDDCAASGTYTANDSGFTNPADTWLWTVAPPVVGVDLTDAALKTCTVTTPTSAIDLAFNLKVVATDSVSTDTANRTSAFTQEHTNLASNVINGLNNVVNGANNVVNT